MKERQRWQPEEDDLLRNYVQEFGAKDWGKVSERTGNALDRDAKSCMERWKNYLKPGIKKTPLTQEEKNLVISLQEKYGNKWKKIAAEVPGRTAKRLGKWWEVYKEKEKKDREKEWGTPLGDELAVNANYNELFKHIAEKLDQRQVGSSSSSVPAPPSFFLQHPFTATTSRILGSSTMETDPFSPQSLYLRHQNPFSIGTVSSSSSMNTTSLPVASPFNFETEEARLIESGSSARPQPTSVDNPIGPSFSLVPAHVQSRSREASSLPPWMSTLPSTSGSGKVFPNLGVSQETTYVGRSRLRSEFSADRSRHLSVGLSLASSPSPRDGVDVSSPNWSHNTEGLTSKTRLSVGEEPFPGHRTSWYHVQHPTGESSGGLMDEVRIRNVRPNPKSLEDLIEYWKDLDDKSKIWSAQRKEESWRIKRLKRQMVEEKLAKGRKKAEEVDSQTQALRLEERKYMEDLELEYWEKVEMIEREAESEESRRFDEWIGRQQEIIQAQKRFLEEYNRRSEAV